MPRFLELKDASFQLDDIFYGEKFPNEIKKLLGEKCKRSDDLIEFVNMCCEYEKNKRPTAEELMETKFITNNAEKKMIDDLNFSSFPEIEKYLAHKIPMKENEKDYYS